MIVLISIVISDSSIGISGMISNNILINILCLITWSTYILGCSLLNYNYTIKRD